MLCTISGSCFVGSLSKCILSICSGIILHAAQMPFCRPVVLASSVENMWASACPDSCDHLPQTLWLSCGAGGMRVSEHALCQHPKRALFLAKLKGEMLGNNKRMWILGHTKFNCVFGVSRPTVISQPTVSFFFQCACTSCEIAIDGDCIHVHVGLRAAARSHLTGSS